MNLYADTGKIIASSRYVSRSDIEKEIIDRTMGDIYGSISVVGMQRMGKSSIVNHIYTQYHDDCFERHIIMLSMSLNDFNSLPHFYKTIAELIIEELEDHDIDIPQRLNSIMDKMNASDDDRVFNQLTRFIKFLKKSLSYRLYIILDEFDRSRTMFKDNSGYAQLRSLLYNSATAVTFVFVSRRMVSELEKQLDESSLSGTLGTPIYVTPYNEEELSLYFDIAKEAGYEITISQQNDLLALMGSYPYWLDLFMYRLVDEGNQMDMNALFDRYAGVFYREFDILNSILDEQGLLMPLMQLIFGPVYDCTLFQVKSLEDYAVIHYNDENDIMTLSPKYEAYLQSKRKDIDFAPKWHECERLLRRMLKYEYQLMYGNDWEETLINMYDTGDIKGMILDALNNKNTVLNDRQYYDSGVSVTIIDTATTGTLFMLYSLFDDDFFTGKLKMRKSEFIDMARHLRYVRNK